MSVVRVLKNKNYTQMSNYHFKDKSLSLKAKGLISLILSLPENWDYSINGLMTLSSDGETSVRSCLLEMEEHGYLKRTRIYENGRIVDWEYIVYEEPQNLDVGNQVLGNQVLANRSQLNTNKLNTKKENTNKIANPADSAKLFSTSSSSDNLETKKHSKQDKQIKVFLRDKSALLAEFNFASDVEEQLGVFLETLVELKHFIPDIAFRMQLDDLIKLSTAKQLSVVKTTIKNGWKSLSYAISNLDKVNNSSVDTSKDTTSEILGPNVGKNRARREGGYVF